jgi:hypothetical protein
MFPLARSKRMELVMRMVPPVPLALTRYNRSPSIPRSPARVTTNDGSRSRMTRVPQTAPMTAVVSIPPAMASHHGRLWVVDRIAVIVPPMPAT